MSAERLPIISRTAARAKRMQTVQHAFAAFVLARAAIDHLKQGHGDVLPWLEVIAAAILIAAAAREFVRQARGSAHYDAVGWVEIAGGIMTLAEAVARTRERHHLSFLILSFMQPVVLFTFGIFDVRIARARYLEANDEGLVLRTRLLSRRRLPWAAARSFRFNGTTLEVTADDGVRTLPMRNVGNFEEAKEWTSEQFRRRNIAPL
jgi:hypothetical protein